ncbi:MAG TPA: exopolysaccharide biosynthesis protein [Caulobacteraceae bacterium]|jgi:hypothetical protein
MATKPPTQSLEDTLKSLLRSRKAELTLGDLMQQVERADGLGPVLVVLTLPVLLPMPPGVSMVLALPLLFVTPQIVVMRREVWLPRFLCKRTIKRKDLAKVTRRVRPLLRRLEKVAKPRLSFLASGPGSAVVGVACTAIAVVLVLPIPFANLVPAMAMGAFAVGLTRKDGLFVLGGYALIAIAVAVIIAGVHGVTFGIDRLKALF